MVVLTASRKAVGERCSGSIRSSRDMPNRARASRDGLERSQNGTEWRPPIVNGCRGATLGVMDNRICKTR